MFLPAALFIWGHFLIGVANAAGEEDIAPIFTWISVPQMTTCQAATVTWLWGTATTNADAEMVISITNFGVAQNPAPSATKTGIFTSHNGRALGGSVRTWMQRREITEDISGSILASSQFFTWSQVNVTDGWYALIATFPGTSSVQGSSAFYVNGADTSCLGSASQSASSGTPTGPPTTASSPSLTSSGDSSSQSGGVLPVDGASSSSKVNRGAIAGGVIGGLAIIAAAIAAFIYLRYASASTGGKKRTRNWAGLTSTDSKAPRSYPGGASSRTLGGPSTGSGRHHSQSDSIGPMLGGHDNNVYVIGNVGIESRPSRINTRLEHDDAYGGASASYNRFSPSQEKFASSSSPPIRSPFSDSGNLDDDEVPMDDLITPLPGSTAAGNVTRNSSTSTASHMTNNSRHNFSRPRSHPSSPYASPTATAMESPFSSPQNNGTDSSLGHYPPSSSSPPSSAFPSGTSAYVEAAAAGPIFPAPPAARRTSTGEALGRRVARKAVPQYNPDDPALAAAASQTAGVPESDSSESLTEGKPVHYLIPDMPPPQRD